MYVSRDEDLRRRSKILKNQVNFRALQVMDKIVRFSLQFGNENLYDSLIKVIGNLEDLQISTKITTLFTKRWIVM